MVRRSGTVKPRSLEVQLSTGPAFRSVKAEVWYYAMPTKYECVVEVRWGDQLFTTVQFDLPRSSRKSKMSKYY